MFSAVEVFVRDSVLSVCGNVPQLQRVDKTSTPANHVRLEFLILQLFYAAGNMT